MADNEGNGEELVGIERLKKHVLDHKIDVAMWACRVFALLFTVGYFIPIFWNPYSLYYKALLCNAAVNALRLHQRMPQVSLSRSFVQKLLTEDSAHYVVYTLIFVYIAPITLVLLPVFLFSLLHSASYSLTLLDVLGQNVWWGARLLISLVEFQSRNILRLVSFTEIFLLPFTVFIIFLGRGNLLTPFMYYQFLTLRYASLRNPYTRNMFHELRVVADGIAAKPAVPDFIKKALQTGVAFTCRLAPAIPQAQEQ